jgi:hypothetical protein
MWIRWIRIRNTGFLQFLMENGSKFLSSSLLPSLHALIFSSGKVSSSFFKVTELADGRGKHLVGKTERKTAKLLTLTVAYYSTCYLFYVLTVQLIQDEDDSCLLFYLLLILCSNCSTDSG